MIKLNCSKTRLSVSNRWRWGHLCSVSPWGAPMGLCSVTLWMSQLICCLVLPLMLTVTTVPGALSIQQVCPTSSGSQALHMPQQEASASLSEHVQTCPGRPPMPGRGVQAELRRWAGMLLSGLSGLQLQGTADSASVDRRVTHRRLPK